MTISDHVVKMISKHPEWFPFQFTHSWKRLPHDLNYNYCFSCAKKIFVGDMCIVSYGIFTSIVICYDCYIDNQEIISNWM
jgi:hypothetical protein